MTGNHNHYARQPMKKCSSFPKIVRLYCLKIYATFFASANLYNIF